MRAIRHSTASCSSPSGRPVSTVVPVCPVRQPLTRNVRYYPSAAAAEDAGFRPCLRCRPETAPDTPAWSGSRATVTRALRLIGEGALDHVGVEAFAARLGLGPRQLARLFRKHLATTPTAAARTSRIQRAKRLIDQTDLPMTEIAHLAGFESLRTFNAVFQQTYRRPPTSLRRQTRVLVAHGLSSDGGAVRLRSLIGVRHVRRSTSHARPPDAR